MTFYAPNGRVRPIRLPESTRRFAYDSLNHKYGLDTKKTPAVSLDDVLNYEEMTKLERYDLAIERIVKEAPIRICDGERISGAATLGNAIKHWVPANYKDEKVCISVSHLTVDFESVLKIGIDGIRKNAEASLEKHLNTDREPFLRSCVHTLDCFDIWHSRYLKALKDLPQYSKNYQNLQNVPHRPAQNFYEAVQSIWFVFAFLRLCGNWPGIGRIDYLLGAYLKNDLQSGTITLEEARDILAHFFIKGCEWVCGGICFGGSGDAQHYQNLVIAGVDENGEEITNEVTYLVLDILEELGISDFPTTVRLNKKSDAKLVRRVAEVMRFGGGMLAIYNEDLILDALTKTGYTQREARKFANDGCWEVQIPGKTYFSYIPFDSLKLLQRQTLGGYGDNILFDDFEALYSKYVEDIRSTVNDIFNQQSRVFLNTELPVSEWKWKPQLACTTVSLFEGGCIEKGLSYFEGGPVYNVISPHIGGFADTVNSLYTIKKLIFDENKLTLPEFFCVLRSNWKENEPLRQYIINRYSYYGNDNDEVDDIASRLLSDFADICESFNGRSPYHFAAGVSTFGRQLVWAPERMAAAHGRYAGEVLAANCSPTPNTDKVGATAIIRSYCKSDLSKLAVGSALDIKLLPSSVEGEDGLQALVALLRGFVTLGGFFMQPDVADAEILREAQTHPENYQNLSVRVSGWNARFVTMNKEWQDMVIAQNEH